MPWAFLYLALIPLAATVYWHLPAGSFHDQNLVFEGGLQGDRAALAGHLSYAIGTRSLTQPWVAESEPVALIPSSEYVSEIRSAVDGRILLQIQGGYAGVRKSPIVSGHFLVWVVTDPAGYLKVGDKVNIPVADADSFSGAPPAGGPAPPISILLPPPSTNTVAEADSGWLVLPSNWYEGLLRLQRADAGDPHYASGLWWRMAYFSAVTITTVGFGDIAPVTTQARVFVAAEAILGIIFVGLFLNALATRWAAIRRR